MNNTVALSLKLENKIPWAEILVAELSELNFDAFEDNADGIIAYGNEDLIDLDRILTDTSLSSGNFKFEQSVEIIPYQNWNEVWENDFEPVFVGDRLAILAPFHDENLKKELTIYIQPKTSFGTGHHQTTWMMANAIMEEEKIPENVLDMGTGTGVLAFLVEKLGAKHILAIDIEDWSVENTIENSERNSCTKVLAKCGDVDLIDGQKFDLVLANINKNVLKKHLNSYLSALNKNGKLMLSGFFEIDCEELISFSENLGLKFVQQQTKESWAQLTFLKQ